MLYAIHWTINLICVIMAILGHWAIANGHERLADICVLSFPIFCINLFFLPCMKLTKAQRLFIKAGEAQCLMKESRIGHDKAQHRKERKKLIREALAAARSENTEHYMNGINEVLRQIGR